MSRVDLKQRIDALPVWKGTDPAHGQGCELPERMNAIVQILRDLYDEIEHHHHPGPNDFYGR